MKAKHLPEFDYMFFVRASVCLHASVRVRFNVCTRTMPTECSEGSTEGTDDVGVDK